MTATLPPTADTPAPAAERPPVRRPLPDRPAHLGSAEWFLFLVTLAVIAGFTRIFTGATYALVLLVVAAATHGGLAVARRRGVHLGVAALGTVIGFVVLASWLFFRRTTLVGIPMPGTFRAAHDALTSSWQTFEQVVAPTHPQTGFLLAAAAAICFAAFLADWAAFRLWAPIEALVPTFTLAAFTMFVGTSRGQVLTTVLYAAAALGFVLEHRVAQRERTTTWLANQVERGSSWLVRVGAAAIVVSVVLGAVVASHLPGAGQAGVVHLHGNQGGAGDRVTISPLVNIGSKLNEQADVQLFTVTSPRPAYWRLTSLDTFTGQIWESSGKYDSANGHLSGTLPAGVPDPGRAAQFDQTFQISHLAELWLPAAYVPVSLHTDAFRARYQGSSSTLIVDTNLQNSDSQSYTVTSVAPDYTPAELRAATTAIPDAIAKQDLAVPGLSASAKALAQRLTASARTPYDKAMALQSYFRSTGGFVYDTQVNYQNSDAAIDQFLKQKRGYCQQFAGTFAALARSIGLPTRVAVGFTPGLTDTDQPDVYDVRGAQAHAWPEVYLGQYGWVPFEPTPGRGAPDETSYLGITPEQSTGPGGPNVSTGPAATTPTTVSTAPSIPSTTLPTRPLAAPASGSGGQGFALSTWVAILAAFALAAALLYGLAVPTLLALRHRRRHDRARDPGARVRLAWVESEEALELIGQSRRRDETAREFADRAATRLPDQSGGLRGLASVSDAAVFGAEAIDDETATAAEETTRSVRAVVGEQVPWWRRWLDQLDVRRLRVPGPS